MTPTCPICSATSWSDPLLAVDRVPVANSRLYASAEEAAAAPSGSLDIRVCTRCGTGRNLAFEPGLVDYGEGYEDTQAHSPRFVAFATETIDRLVERYGLDGARTLEIGCGKGDFLRLVCRRTGGPGIGLDPAFSPGALDDDGLDLVFEARPYGPGESLEADLVVCRHTLEHLDDPAALMAAVADNHEPGTVVYLEVPDLTRILDDGAFWDLYYEHVTYFSPASLAAAAERAGLAVDSVDLAFDDQYVCLTGRVAGTGDVGSRPWPGHDPGAIAAFTARVDAALSRLRAVVADRTVCLWGASSKAVALVTVAPDLVGGALVTDINPRKWGRVLPTGNPVVAPSDLASRGVEVVVVMNPVYEAEIRADLAESGVDVDVHPLA
ncbi:MAG: methyltransferase domain-containing protein [Actinomyces sp.]|nr:MAG: methyltransferase domain-containing protein [Actinomyces sp.]